MNIYRTTLSRMIDDEDYRALSPLAKLLIHTLRFSRIGNLAGIFRFGKGEFEIIAEQIEGKDKVSRVELWDALRELIESPNHWVYHSDGVLWIRNQLRSDPAIPKDERGFIHNRTHKIAVERILESLPNCEIVVDFRKYYGFAGGNKPGLFDTAGDGASDTVLDRVSDRVSDAQLQKTITSTSTEDEWNADDFVSWEGDPARVHNFIKAWNEFMKTPHYRHYLEEGMDLKNSFFNMVAWIRKEKKRGEKRDFVGFIRNWLNKDLNDMKSGERNGNEGRRQGRQKIGGFKRSGKTNI